MCFECAQPSPPQPVVGVVYNFVLDQLFAAKKGGGATMNGKKIHVSMCIGESLATLQPLVNGCVATERDQALVVTALGNQRSEHLLRPKLETILELARDPSPVHGYVCAGHTSVCEEVAVTQTTLSHAVFE